MLCDGHRSLLQCESIHPTPVMIEESIDGAHPSLDDDDRGRPLTKTAVPYVCCMMPPPGGHAAEDSYHLPTNADPTYPTHSYQRVLQPARHNGWRASGGACPGRRRHGGDIDGGDQGQGAAAQEDGAGAVHGPLLLRNRLRLAPGASPMSISRGRILFD